MQISMNMYVYVYTCMYVYVCMYMFYNIIMLVQHNYSSTT